MGQLYIQTYTFKKTISVYLIYENDQKSKYASEYIHTHFT